MPSATQYLGRLVHPVYLDKQSGSMCDNFAAASVSHKACMHSNSCM